MWYFNLESHPHLARKGSVKFCSAYSFTMQYVQYMNGIIVQLPAFQFHFFCSENPKNRLFQPIV